MLKIEIKEKKYKKKIFVNTELELEKTNGIISIIGESGVGKTTLINILLGLDKDYVGDVQYNNKSLKNMSKVELANYRNSIVSCVYQDLKLFESLTVIDNIKINNYSNADEEFLLKKLGIQNLKDQKVMTLSGGEKQRVAIARALINNPEILIFDEPTNNMSRKNVENFISILEELKFSTQIIVITHDSRIEDVSQIVYYIEDYKIQKIQKEQVEAMDFAKNIDDKKDRKTNFKLSKLIFNDKKGLILNIIGTTFLILIYLLILSIFSNVTLTNLNYFYGGLDEDIIAINSTQLKKDYIQDLGISYENIDTNGTRLYWSEEDKSNIENIEGVEEVYLLESDNYFIMDTDNKILKMEIDTEDLPKSINVNTKNEIVDLEFQTLPAPSEIVNSYYPLTKINLLEGTYPVNNSDEIIIPDIYADLLINEGQYENYLDIIDNEVELNVEKLDGSETDIKKLYKVKGIYDTDYEKKIDSKYIIYLGNNEYVDLEYILTDDFYESIKKDIEDIDSIQYKEYLNDIYRTKDSYEKSVGTGLPEMVIVTNDKVSQKEINNQIEEIFPEYVVKSQYNYKNGSNSDVYKKIRGLYILYMIVATIIFTLIIYIIFKNYYKQKQKQISILTLLGYYRSKIFIQILMEISISYIIGSIISVIIFKFLNVPISNILYYALLVFNIIGIALISFLLYFKGQKK